MNIDISRTSMARWAIQSADFLGDLAFEIKNYILSQNALHADETTIQVLHEPGKKAQTNSYMWMIFSPENTHPTIMLSPKTKQSDSVAGRTCAENL